MGQEYLISRAYVDLGLFSFLDWEGIGEEGIYLPVNAVVFTSPCAVEIKLLLGPLRKGRPFPAPNVVAGIAWGLASMTGVEPWWVFKSSLFVPSISPPL